MRRAYNAGRWDAARTHASHLFKDDFSWWAMVYPPAFDLLQQQWRSTIEGTIRSALSIMPMPYALHEVNHFDED